MRLMLQEVELKVIKIDNMAKKRQALDPVEDICNTIKKLLALELFKMNVSQSEIAKKLRIDLNIVNGFLKGIKKQK